MPSKKIKNQPLQTNKILVSIIFLLTLTVAVLTYKILSAPHQASNPNYTSPTLSDAPKSRITYINEQKNRYSEREGGYSINYPSDWTIKSNKTIASAVIAPYDDIILYSPDYRQTSGQLFYPSISDGASIFIRHADTLYKTAEERFQNTATSKKYALNKRMVLIGGIEGIQYDYQVDQEKGTNSSVIVDGQWYIFTFKYPNQAVKEMYLQTYNDVLSSFIVQ